MKPKTETGQKIDDALQHVQRRIIRGVLICLPLIIIVLVIVLAL